MSSSSVNCREQLFKYYTPRLLLMCIPCSIFGVPQSNLWCTWPKSPFCRSFLSRSRNVNTWILCASAIKCWCNEREERIHVSTSLSVSLSLPPERSLKVVIDAGFWPGSPNKISCIVLFYSVECHAEGHLRNINKCFCQGTGGSIPQQRQSMTVY